MTEQSKEWLAELVAGKRLPKGMAALRFQREERQPSYRDCLIFYRDGRVRFERYCYGEAACLVFGVWVQEITSEGELRYKGPFGVEVREEELPRQLTMTDRESFQLDGKQWKWTVAATLRDDPANGYPRWKMLMLSLFGR